MIHLTELMHLTSEVKEKNGLLHTPAEILQQPNSWATTFLNFQQRHSEIAAFLRSAGVEINSNQRPIVFLIGAGSSDYIGQSLVSLFQQRWRCEAIAIASTDLLTNLEDYVSSHRQYLWISFSRSGDSPESVAVLDRAMEDYPNVFHFVVSCNANGQMIRAHRGNPKVFGILLDDAVNDRGLAMTSSFSNMIIVGQCLASLGKVDEYEPVLHSLIAGAEGFLETAAESAAMLAEGPYTSVCFAGSGSLKSIARESALKVSELTAGRIRTMAESALGLRHGPIAALNKETLFVSYISSDSRRQQYETDLLMEIGSKGVVRTRVAVGLAATKELKHACELFLSAGADLAIPDAYRPPLDVIFGQWLGVFFSIRCNLKPDSPSPDGVISRVVQNVELH